MLSAFILVPASFVFSAIAVALILRLSHKKSWYDHIDERKIHTGDIPRLGGIGFAAAFIVIVFIINFSAAEANFGLRFLPSLIGIIVLSISGVYDDFRPQSPRVKLLIQIAAALCVIIPGYTFHRLFYPDLGNFPSFDWIRYPLTLLWIVGMINAMNFIDGVDGLAGGIAVLEALTFALIFSSFKDTGSTVLICVCLAAAVAGFLVFNAPFPRAKIFMGDGGSQFLGFAMALLPLIEKGDNPANLPVFYVAALFAIPVLDIIAAVWRRVRDGRRIDSPDKSHIHHKLMNLGCSSLGVDCLLWALQIVLSSLVFIAIKAEGWLSLFILIIAYLVAVTFFSVIHFMNRKVYKQLKLTGDKTC
jgi:UDP-GlcNAc:undecaprenyl-phosphate GlcNAc-1-phosphate transferase